MDSDGLGQSRFGSDRLGFYPRLFGLVRRSLPISPVPRDPSPRPSFCRLHSYKVTFFVFNGLRVDLSAKCNFVTGSRARWRKEHVRKNVGLIYLDLVGFSWIWFEKAGGS